MRVVPQPQDAGIAVAVFAYLVFDTGNGAPWRYGVARMTLAPIEMTYSVNRCSGPKRALPSGTGDIVRRFFSISLYDHRIGLSLGG